MNSFRALILLVAALVVGSFAQADQGSKPVTLIAAAPVVVIEAEPTTQFTITKQTITLESVTSHSTGVLEIKDSTPPEQAIVIDPHRPWVDGAKWDGNAAPTVYGVDETLAQPRFAVGDADSSCLWAYRLTLPIEVKKYPMLSMKYRAMGASKSAAYVLRIVFNNGDAKSRANAWSGADLIADGQEHELDEDLRTISNGNLDVFNFGIGLKADDKAATFDLVEMKFSAASDSPNEKLKDDLPVRVRVVDGEGHPLKDAKVIVDAERANFARSGQTGQDGVATVTPLLNEAGKHMVRVEKSGYMSLEAGDTSSESGQAIEIKTYPAVSYGGIAKDKNGVVAAGARVAVMLEPKLYNSLPMQFQTNVVTDEKGQWAVLPQPADAGKVIIKVYQRDAGGKEEVNEGDAKGFAVGRVVEVVSGGDVGNAKKSATQVVAVANAQATEKQQVVKGPPPVTVIVEKVDESTTAVGLRGIDHDQLQIVRHPEPGKDEEGTMAMMDVTDVMFKKASVFSNSENSSTATTRPTDRLAGCRVTMAGEDRINGDVVGWTEKRISIRPNVAPTIAMDVSASQVREIWCGTADQVKKAQDLKEQNGTEDVLFAAKDAEVVAVHGIATGIQGSDLHFLYNDQDRKIALNRVVGLILAKPSDAEAQQSDAFYQTVQFVTGEQISGHVTGYDGKHLTVAMLGSGQEAQLPVDEVATISMRNGRVVYLSDMKPSKVEQTPFFDRLMPYRMDQSLTGKPIVLLDGSYPKGISVHSRCVLTFDIGGKFDELRTKVGFALPEGKIGEAAIRVIGDGKTLWEKADAHGDQMPDDLKLKVGGVHELTLEVDYGKNDDTGDRVSWANARLIRAAVGK